MVQLQQIQLNTKLSLKFTNALTFIHGASSEYQISCGKVINNGNLDFLMHSPVIVWQNSPDCDMKLCQFKRQNTELFPNSKQSSMVKSLRRRLELVGLHCGGPGAVRRPAVDHTHTLLPHLGLDRKVTEGQHSSLDSKGKLSSRM